MIAHEKRIFVPRVPSGSPCWVPAIGPPRAPGSCGFTPPPSSGELGYSSPPLLPPRPPSALPHCFLAPAPSSSAWGLSTLPFHPPASVHCIFLLSSPPALNPVCSFLFQTLHFFSCTISIWFLFFFYQLLLLCGDFLLFPSCACFPLCPRAESACLLTPTQVVPLGSDSSRPPLSLEGRSRPLFSSLSCVSGDADREHRRSKLRVVGATCCGAPLKSTEVFGSINDYRGWTQPQLTPLCWEAGDSSVLSFWLHLKPVSRMQQSEQRRQKGCGVPWL